MPLTFNHYDNYRGVVVSAALTPVAAIAVGIRFWLRCLQPGLELWWDDWLLLLDLPILIGQNGLFIWFQQRALNENLTELSSGDLTLALKLLWAYYHLFNWGISLAKLSALFFYARIFTVDTALITSIKLSAALVVSWPLAYSISAFVECRPLSKAWAPWTPGKCFDIRAWWLSNAISDTVIDLIILVIPMPILWKTRLTLARKITVFLVLLIGYSLAASSLRRISSIKEYDGNDNKYQRMDINYNVFPPKYNFWPVYETSWGIISVCTPCIFSFGKLAFNNGLRSLFTFKPKHCRNQTNKHSTVALVTTRRDQSFHELPEHNSQTCHHLEGEGLGRPCSTATSKDLRHLAVHQV